MTRRELENHVALSNTLAYIILLAASGVTLLALRADALAAHATGMIVIAMAAKLFCIAYFFMDLRYAHPVYILSALLYILLMAGGFSYAIGG